MSLTSPLIVPGGFRTQPPSKIPKAHPSNGRADEQSANVGVQMETLMEMQESSKSEKGGGGRVVVEGGGGKTTTDISGNFTGMANPMWSAEDFNI